MSLFLHDAERCRTCKYCKRNLPETMFPKHSGNKDGRDRRCRECIKSEAQVRKHIMKTAPPRPFRCECCDEVPEKWSMDHDHETKRFRGWICETCNHGIGKLGDNVEGLEKAIRYLEKTNDRSIQRHSSLYSTDKE